MNPLEQIFAQAARDKKNIVLPEGADARVAQAAMRAAARGAANVMLLGAGGEIAAPAREVSAAKTAGMRIIDARNNPRADVHAEALLRARAGKGMTRAQAMREIQSPLALAMCMLACGDADGCVAGAAHTSADVLRAALQIVGAKTVRSNSDRETADGVANKIVRESYAHTADGVAKKFAHEGDAQTSDGVAKKLARESYAHTADGVAKKFAHESDAQTAEGVAKKLAHKSVTQTPPPAPGLVSSFFLMLHQHPHQALQGAAVFADCAMVVDPDAEQLARIAMDTADSAAALLHIAPRVALLSFSTAGSARHAHVDKVHAAAEIVAAHRADIVLLPEVQFDAAVSPQILARKAPQLAPLAPANVFIFPDLQSANIGYKIAERLGAVVAVGPVIQGLARPVNDLSRGCRSEDIDALIALTAVQAQNA